MEDVPEEWELVTTEVLVTREVEGFEEMLGRWEVAERDGGRKAGDSTRCVEV